MREILRVVEVIPYKNENDWKNIIMQYRKDSIIKTFRNFVYIERITGVEE